MGALKESRLKIGAAIFVVNLAISVISYPMLPERIIIHWGAGGVPDGYSSKLVGVALMQVVQLFVLGLYVVIPRVDPQEKVKASSKYFSNTLNLLMAYFTFFNVIFITQNLGYSYNITSLIVPSIGVLLFLIGDNLSKAEQNWFFGIRTPWTLSSEEVWNSTHEKAGVLFKACGAVTVASLLVPQYSIWIALIPICLTGLYLVVFSYIEFKKTG